MGLRLGPCPKREVAADVLISRFGEQLHELPRGSTIGTSSPRRQAQIAYRFKKRSYRLVPLRGNVETRLKKLAEAHYDAIVLAHAGLKRLGLEKEITQILPEDVLLPAPGQGCLGLELRDNDEATLAVISTIKDAESDITARAERAFLSAIGGDCLMPLAAQAAVSGTEIKMRALLIHPSGEKAVESIQVGEIHQPEYVGARLAERLLFEGGSDLLTEIENLSLRETQ
jgi:hydroxymethylbilane synthase